MRRSASSGPRRQGQAVVGDVCGMRCEGDEYPDPIATKLESGQRRERHQRWHDGDLVAHEEELPEIEQRLDVLDSTDLVDCPQAGQR